MARGAPLLLPLSAALAALPSPASCFVALPNPPPAPLPPSWSRLRASLAPAPSATSSAAPLGPRLAIDESYPNLRLIHASPDVYVIDEFLDDSSCQDLIDRARNKGDMAQSPVAYGGWSRDVADLTELAAKGPVAWGAIGLAWVQVHDAQGAGTLELVGHMVANFAALLVVAVAGIGLFTKVRADGLQEMRTSTSTTLPEAGGGAGEFVRRAARLLGGESGDGDGKRNDREEATRFEAPTVIRYERDQVLRPHYDANRGAELEDANRGGQTLATLIVYLNDVAEGGQTRFGRLPQGDGKAGDGDGDGGLTVRPRRGDALLFFPADAAGAFDERTEHEGRPAVDEKWIARIWRHADRVPPPFGLADSELKRLWR